MIYTYHGFPEKSSDFLSGTSLDFSGGDGCSHLLITDLLGLGLGRCPVMDGSMPEETLGKPVGKPMRKP